MASVEINIGHLDESSEALDLELNVPVTAASALYFDNIEEAAGHPLAQALLRLDCVSAVLLQGRRVTVCRANGVGVWSLIVPRLTSAIEQHFAAMPVAVPRRPRSADENALMLDIQELLNQQINPMVSSHGGFIEVVDVRDTAVFVNMTGGCQGCGMAAATLRQGVERVLRRALPQITEIYDSTDHASGANPYYASK